MINALANVNELAHAVGYQKFLRKKKSFKVVGGKVFDNGKSLNTILKRWKTAAANVGATPVMMDIKDDQGRRGAAEIVRWLSEGAPGRPIAWNEKYPRFFNGKPITIEKVAWTPCTDSFEHFLKTCVKCKVGAVCANISHDNNPSDVLLAVKNTAGATIIIGISLKATFKNTALTIYNGGVCGFLYLIVNKGDLEKKNTYCKTHGPVKGTPYETLVPQVTAPYDKFLKSLLTIHGYPAAAANKAVKGNWWKDNVRPSRAVILDPALEKRKSNALGGVRDNLFSQMAAKWGGASAAAKVAAGAKEIEINITRPNLTHILAGILQFTHKDAEADVCAIPYVKLTAFGNKTFERKAPAISGYLELAGSPGGGGGGGGGGAAGAAAADAVGVKIVKRASDSLMLCIFQAGLYIPHFLLRVKVASRPPGSLKIDGKPVNPRTRCMQTGGARQELPQNVERLIDGAPGEVEVLLKNLLEDIFPDCDETLEQQHVSARRARGILRAKRDCYGRLVAAAPAVEANEEYVACKEDEPRWEGEEDIKQHLMQGMENYYKVAAAAFDDKRYPTRFAQSEWDKQKIVVISLAKYLFGGNDNHWRAVFENSAVGGGGRKRRRRARRSRKRRRRRYKKRNKTRRRKTRRKKY